MITSGGSLTKFGGSFSRDANVDSSLTANRSIQILKLGRDVAESAQIIHIKPTEALPDPSHVASTKLENQRHRINGETIRRSRLNQCRGLESKRVLL